MANERTVPLLPCASIDEMTDFYTALGFERTYRQTRPNPYVALRREDLHLHFFGLPGFRPEDSYGTCLVVVADVAALHRAFADGLRAHYGRVPIAGIPRLTRPRPRRNADGVTGFSVVDPAGNWIRITADPDAPRAEAPTGRLARTLANAVVQADSRGEPAQAAHILDGALRDPDPAEEPMVLAEALAYRAELALSLSDPDTARTLLARVAELPIPEPDRERLTADLAAQLG